MEPIFFEKLVIKFLFSNQEVREKIYPFLSPKIFDDINHIQIIKKIMEFYDKYKKFPKINDLKLCIDKEEIYNVLKSIMEIDTSEYDNDLLLDEIEDFFKKKLILNVITDTATNLNEDEMSKISKAPDQMREALSFSFNTTVGFDLFNNPEKMYEYLHTKDSVIPTGILNFDKMIDGGFHEKSLTLFLAETNMGKTLVMCSLAVNAILQNKNVLYITLEMSEKEISKRITSNIFDTMMDDLVCISKDKFIETFNKIKKQVDSKFIVKEYPTKSINTNNLRNLIKELEIQTKFKPDIIFVDYIGLMLPCQIRKEENSYSELKRISEELRGFAVEITPPIVSAIQANRKGFGSAEIDLTNVSDSIGTTGIADLIIAITQSEEFRKLGKYLWLILKNRFGLNKKKRSICVNYSKMRVFEDKDSKEENLEGVSSPPNEKEDQKKLNETVDDVIGLLNSNDELSRNKIIEFE